MVTNSGVMLMGIQASLYIELGGRLRVNKLGGRNLHVFLAPTKLLFRVDRC